MIGYCGLNKGVATCDECPDFEKCAILEPIIANNPSALENLQG